MDENEKKNSLETKNKILGITEMKNKNKIQGRKTSIFVETKSIIKPFFLVKESVHIVRSNFSVCFVTQVHILYRMLSVL